MGENKTKLRCKRKARSKRTRLQTQFIKYSTESAFRKGASAPFQESAPSRKKPSLRAARRAGDPAKRTPSRVVFRSPIPPAWKCSGSAGAKLRRIWASRALATLPLPAASALGQGNAPPFPEVDRAEISSDNLSAMSRHRISDLMNSDVVCARPGMTVAEVRELLATRGIGGAPVVDDSGKILGVVSQSDLVRKNRQPTTVGESGHFFTNVSEYRELANLPRDRSDAPVETVMSKEAYTVPLDCSAAAGAKLMRKRKIHRLLVTDGGLLVGVVTALDLLRVVEEA